MRCEFILQAPVETEKGTRVAFVVVSNVGSAGLDRGERDDQFKQLWSKVVRKA